MTHTAIESGATASRSEQREGWRGSLPTVITPALFVKVFKEWHPKLYRRALKHTNDHDTAEFLASGTLIALHESYVVRARYNENGHEIGNLLQTILRRRLADRVRSRAYRSESREYSDDVGIPAESIQLLAQSLALSPEASLTESERNAAIERAINRLPKRDRTIIVCYMNCPSDHGYRDDICEELGESVRANIGSWLSRVKAKLRTDVELSKFRPGCDE